MATKIQKNQINSVTTSQIEDLDASLVPYVPAGNLASTDVEGAINELDTEKQETLISGTNIKTIGGNSLLGSGDLPTVDYTTGWQNQYHSDNFTTTNNGEMFSWVAIGTGTIGTTNDTGRIGLKILQSSASGSTGYGVETNSGIFRRSEGMFLHAIVRCPVASATVNTRIGFHINNTIALGTSGAFFQIANNTVTPTNRDAGVSATGSTYTINTTDYYVYQIIFGASDTRFMIMSEDGTILDDQTISTRTPSVSAAMYGLIQGWNTGAAATNCAVVDYWGFGKTF